MKTVIHICGEHSTEKYDYWTELIDTYTVKYQLECPGYGVQCRVYDTKEEAWADADYTARVWAWPRKWVTIREIECVDTVRKDHRRKRRA